MRNLPFEWVNIRWRHGRVSMGSFLMDKHMDKNTNVLKELTKALVKTKEQDKS